MQTFFVILLIVAAFFIWMQVSLYFSTVKMISTKTSFYVTFCITILALFLIGIFAFHLFDKRQIDNRMLTIGLIMISAITLPQTLEKNVKNSKLRKIFYWLSVMMIIVLGIDAFWFADHLDEITKDLKEPYPSKISVYIFIENIGIIFGSILALAPIFNYYMENLIGKKENKENNKKQR